VLVNYSEICIPIKITAKQMFRLLDKYRPETRAARKARLRSKADSKVKGKEEPPSKRATSLKQGANCVTRSIEQKKAQLVVIAHDVYPLEVKLYKYTYLNLQFLIPLLTPSKIRQ
jgi:large subunit ribosomal protein L7Ae